MAPTEADPHRNGFVSSVIAAVGIYGTKAGMMSYFTEDGLCVPATVIALEEGNIVTAVKTDETDGYNAVQVSS